MSTCSPDDGFDALAAAVNEILDGTHSAAAFTHSADVGLFEGPSPASREAFDAEVHETIVEEALDALDATQFVVITHNGDGGIGCVNTYPDLIEALRVAGEVSEAGAATGGPNGVTATVHPATPLLMSEWATLEQEQENPEQ